MLLRGVGSLGSVPSYQTKVANLFPIAYWPLNELTGTTAVARYPSTDLDGLYVGPTLNSTVGPIALDGAPLWDAANDVLNIYSTALSTTINMNTCTLSMWFKAENWVGVQYLIEIRMANAGIDVMSVASVGST